MSTTLSLYSSYSNSCRTVLLDVCESLMLPVPPDLCSSPDVPAMSPTKSPSHSPSGSEHESLHSLQEISTAGCHRLGESYSHCVLTVSVL